MLRHRQLPLLWEWRRWWLWHRQAPTGRLGVIHDWLKLLLPDVLLLCLQDQAEGVCALTWCPDLWCPLCHLTLQMLYHAHRTQAHLVVNSAIRAFWAALAPVLGPLRVEDAIATIA